MEAVVETQSLVPTGRARHAVRRFRLKVVDGPDRSLTFASRGERAVIGTHPSCDFVLHDPTVTRFHCEIAITDGRASVHDLGSHNGTLVDGLAVDKAYLDQTITLGLGNTRIRFELGADRVSIPLSPHERFGHLVGCSKEMRATFELLERASASDATVLLEGETGTGKEAAAESIHIASDRRDGPLTVVDCAAMPPDLLESELFGHERGSFTGAVASREGAFVAASGGTIFLDELGDLDLQLQPKLLRALEKREVKPVGSNRWIPIDVRVVAATNRSLREEVNARRFRSDLYFRLAVLRVRMPSLRDRLEDLPLLCLSILDGLGVNDEPAAAPLRTEEFFETLRRHSWPGNVRELRNFIERCLALRRPLLPGPETGPIDGRALFDLPLAAARGVTLESFERRYLAELLRKNGQNLTAAARAAHVSRTTLYALLRRLDMR